MSARNINFDDLQRVLDQRPPSPVAGPSAAVAVTFRDGDAGTELLFIQRATKATDPWSGHMAFPGGRTDSGDLDSSHTAERETLEEVDLDLVDATRLGALSDLRPGRHLQAVHAHAYWLDGQRPALTPNYEVADIVWVPLSVLGDRDRYIEFHYELSATPTEPGHSAVFPGIQLDVPSQVVWGLTLRFLADLFERLGLTFIELAPWPGAASD